MKFLIRNYIIFIIILLAVFLRFVRLGEVPPSPDWDEAALGYNAYSVLKTGRDEYGTFLPLSLRSFDDYKPPLYMYLTIPSILIFGLNVWSTRLPSAVFGVMAVFGAYLLVKELLEQNRPKYPIRYLRYWPQISALLLAISPWHLQFSRIAFEANIGVTLNIFAIYFFLKGLKNTKMLIISAFLFSMGLYAYHSERIFIPIMVFVLLLIYWKKILSFKSQVVLPLIVGLITVLPLIPVFLDSTTLMRLKGTSSIADQTGTLARSSRKIADDLKQGSVVGFIYDNRRLVWAKTILEGYLSHYSMRWLFVTGDNPRHHAPDMGLLYLWELPFLILGLYFTAKNGGNLAKILLFWLLIAPLPASPTTELPHAIRSLVFLPSFQIVTALGIITVLDKIKEFRLQDKNPFRRLVSLSVLIFAAFVGLNLIYYFNMYFVHQNHEVSQYWQYGYKQAVEYADLHKDKYNKIIVSTKLEQPHMFFLFYLRYDPQIYLKQGGTISGGFTEVKNRFDKYEFRTIDWEHERRDGSILYIVSPNEIRDNLLATITNLDGTPAIMIADH